VYNQSITESEFAVPVAFGVLGMVHVSQLLANRPKFLSANPVYIPANHHYKSHQHEYNELIVVQRGRLRARLTVGEYVASPGDILLYPAGAFHEEWAEDGEPVLTWVCAFEKQGLSPLFRRDAHGLIQDLVARLTGTSLVAQFSQDETQERCSGLLVMLLEELKQLQLDEADAMVEKVRAFVRANLAQPFTLEDLAAVAGVTKYYFVRHYRAVTGRTPMKMHDCYGSKRQKI